MSYVITRYKTKGMNMAAPEELADDAQYDSRRYVELLADCCATIVSSWDRQARSPEQRTIFADLGLNQSSFDLETELVE